MIKDIYYLTKKVTVYITNPNDHIQKFWLKNVFYEAKGNDMLPYIFNNYVEPVIIDAGANIGNHSLFFNCIMNATVFAFEPHPKAFADLQKNMALNKADGKLFNVALGDVVKLVGMELPDVNNLGMAKIVEQGTDTTVIPLDSLINEFTELDIIKVDIEGYNIPFIKGAVKILQKFKPDLFIECENELLFNETVNELLPLGYRYSNLKFNATPTYLFRWQK